MYKIPPKGNLGVLFNDCVPKNMDFYDASMLPIGNTKKVFQKLRYLK